MRSRKSALIGLIITGLIAVSVYYWLKPNSADAKKTATKTPVVKVQLGRLVQKKLTDSVEAVGSLRAQDSVQLAPEISGQVAAIYFQPGQSVAKGQALMQLDATVALAELRSAKAALVLSQAQYQRHKTLAKQALDSKQSLEAAKADLDTKRAAVAIKSAQFEKMTLRAPFSGQVGEKRVSVGDHLSAGQKVVQLVDSRQLLISYRLPEQYVARLQPGQRVTLTSSAFPGQQFTATVNFIAPAIDEATRTLLIEAKIADPSHQLKPGLFVRLTHHLSSKRQALLAPLKSVRSDSYGAFVYVVAGKKALRKRVELGYQNADLVEITRGLAPSDRLVVAGLQKLNDGAVVTW